MLPEDRKLEGIYPDLDVLANLVIKRPRKTKPRWGESPRSGRRAQQIAGDPQPLRRGARSPDQFISTLSGGNQQKVLLGRALVSKARVLLSTSRAAAWTWAPRSRSTS